MTSQDILVSIVIPTYNSAKYINESIDSVLSQTISNWEIRIVDDCSTDDTYQILLPYLNKYSNIHYYRLEENSGAHVARSVAIKQSVGKYIAFLDSDDLWLPNKLETQIGFMEENDIDFSCTAYRQNNEINPSKVYAIYPPKRTDYKKMLRLSCPIGNSTVIYNQENLGKFTVPNIRKRNDFALWLKILKNTDYCYGLQNELTIYRIREDSISNNKLGLIKYHWELYFRIEKLGLFKSVWYTLCWAWVKGIGIGLKKQKSIDLNNDCY